MWWIIGLTIAGIFGAAKALLEKLRGEVAAERQHWEKSYRQLERQILQQQQVLSVEIQKIQTQDRARISLEHLRTLHRASASLADRTYDLLDDSRKTLDAMGEAIIQAAIQRKELEQRKRRAMFWETGSLEREIQSLHQLRDQILVPDKDRVKIERDRLFNEVRRLNMQTGQLRDTIKLLDGGQRYLPASPALPAPRYRGVVKWFDPSRGFGFIVTPNGIDVHVSGRNVQYGATLSHGDHVEFALRQGDQGYWAAQVTRV